MKLVLDEGKLNISGPRIKKARLDNRLSQQLLAEKLETLAVYIDRSSISKIENQKRIVTDIELTALSQILNVSIDWLLGLER